MDFIGAAPTVDLTYSDVFLVPRRSALTSRLDVDLSPGDGTPATLPLVASNMNSVTGPRLAAVLARRGGLAVLPQDSGLQELATAISQVKQHPVRWDTPMIFAESATVAEARAVVPAVPGFGVVVVRDAAFPAGGQGAVSFVAHGQTHDAESVRIAAADVVGVVMAERLATALPDATLGALVHVVSASVEADSIGEGRAAFDTVHALETEMVCVVDRGFLVGTLTARSALRGTLYRPALDSEGRLAVGAAVGITGDVAAKARALVQAGVDVVVVDTAHGHQESMVRAVSTVAELDLGVPIVAGNVVTAEGARDLVEAGATIVKVGVGPGAMCTTRMMTAVGRPQFSAVLDTAQAAREQGAHVWADGGVKYPRDVALALAAGASSVMIGSWFAGTVEAPGTIQTDAEGRVYKESWGMASTKAVQERFARLDAFERARKELFAEGISSSHIYLDPQRPGVEDLVDMIISGVRSSMTYAGAASLAEFYERAHVGVQSAAGYEEGKALAVSW